MPPVRGSIVWLANDGLRVVRGLVLEDRDLPGGVVSERRDGEIELAVVVEVGSLDVGDARPAVEPHRGTELAVGDRPRIQMTAPWWWSAGKNSPRSATSRSRMPSLSRSTGVTWSGCGMLATIESSLGGAQRRGAEDEPQLHFRRKQVDLPVAVDVRQPHVRDGRHAAHLRHRDRTRFVNLTGDSDGSGQGSGAGRRSGAWLRKNGSAFSMSSGNGIRRSCSRDATGAGFCSRMNFMRRNSSRHCTAGQNVWRRKEVTGAAGSACELFAPRIKRRCLCGRMHERWGKAVDASAVTAQGHGHDGEERLVSRRGGPQIDASTRLRA